MSLRHNTCELIGACSPLIVVGDNIFRVSLIPRPGAWFQLSPPKREPMFEKRGFIFGVEMTLFVIVEMDALPVQGGSKCGGSDFSIERILADRKETREDDVETPDWLCCTRYRPPRLPRSSAVQRARRAGRHARVPFTPAQAQALEAAYARAPYLAPPALKALAAALQLRDDRIKIWFQNRRARERREKSTAISPPQGVNLPPTTVSCSFPPSLWMSHNNYAIRNAQEILIQQRINISDRSFGTNERNSSDSINSQGLRLPHIDRPISIGNLSEADEVDRPDTPLDIETVED